MFEDHKIYYSIHIKSYSFSFHYQGKSIKYILVRDLEKRQIGKIHFFVSFNKTKRKFIEIHAWKTYTLWYLSFIYFHKKIAFHTLVTFMYESPNFF